MSNAIEAKLNPPMTSLMRGMSWSFVGNLIDVACSWAFLMVLIKFGSTEMVGQYGLAIAILSPIFSLTNLQLRALQSTDAKREYAFGDYMAARLVTLVLAFFALVAVLSFDRESTMTILLCSILFVRFTIVAIGDVYLGLLQQNEWIERMSRIQIVAAVVLVASFTAGFVVSGRLVGGVAFSTATMLLPVLFLVIPASKQVVATQRIRSGLSIIWNKDAIWALIRTSAPLGLVSFLISLNSNVPRYFLAKYVGDHDLGIFVALSALLTAGITLVASVTQAVIPRLARLRAEDDKSGFVRLLLRLEAVAVAILIASVMGAYLVGPQIISVVYSSEFAEHRAALVWLAAACGIMLGGRFIGNAITVARRLKIQIATNSAALILLVALNFALVPNYGIAGATASITIAAIVSVGLNFLVCLHFLRSWKTPASDVAIHAA